jgi:hypothetical protein
MTGSGDVTLRVLRLERTKGAGSARSKRQDASPQHFLGKPLVAAQGALVPDHAKTGTDADRGVRLPATRTLWAGDIAAIGRKRRNRHEGAKHVESRPLAQFIGADIAQRLLHNARRQADRRSDR